MAADASPAPVKVVVIGGAGGIGSSIAFNLLSVPGTYDIVLVDSMPHMVTSHVMDLENAVAMGDSADTVRAGTVEEAADADVVLVCAAVPLRPASSRSAFLTENARIVHEVLAPLRDAAFGGLVVMLTNPVDPLVTWVNRQGWLPRQRIVGYTRNDGLRLRTAAARALNAHPRDVGAWTLGEHGEGQVPLYSRITLKGSPVTLTDEQRTLAQGYVDTWYTRHVALDSGRSSTWTTGLGAAGFVAAAANDTRAVLPASVVLDGEYGLTGVSLGVPATIGRDGVCGVVEWELAPDESEAMARAAARVAKATADLEVLLRG